MGGFCRSKKSRLDGGGTGSVWYRASTTSIETVGENIRALDILQNAYRIASNNVAIREKWLILEESDGIEANALRFRVRRHGFDPNDRINTTALARMKGYLNPTRFMLFDDQGNDRYPARFWNQISAVQQQQLLFDEMQAWRAQSDEMLQELEGQGADPFELTLLRATITQSRGEHDQAVLILQEFMNERADDSLELSVIQ